MRIERKLGVAVAATGALLFAVTGTIPALASSGPSAARVQASHVRLATTRNSTNTAFAGWGFGLAKAKSVSTTFKVPAYKCKANSGAAPGDLFITGTGTTAAESGAGVLLVCEGTTPLLVPDVVALGTETNGTKSPHTGDTLKATVTVVGTKVTATVSDVTKGHTFKLTASASGAAAASEELVGSTKVALNGKPLPIVNFGKISFTNGSVSGKPLGAVKPQIAVNMVNSKKVVQISTGKLSGTKKNAFIITWKHS